MLARVKNIQSNSTFTSKNVTYEFNRDKQILIGKIIEISLLEEDPEKKIYQHIDEYNNGWFFHETWLEFVDEQQSKQNNKMKFLLYEHTI